MKCKTLAYAVSLAALLGLGPAAAAGDGNRIEGTWINDVKIVLCQSPQIVVAQFQTLTTYMRGGALIEGAGGTTPPAVWRSASHGIWERIGGDAIQIYFRHHAFDGLGRLVRIVEVENELTLVLGDNPLTAGVVEPYYLSGTGTNRMTNLDPTTGAVTSVTQGCNRADSRPILF